MLLNKKKKKQIRIFTKNKFTYKLYIQMTALKKINPHVLALKDPQGLIYH